MQNKKIIYSFLGLPASGKGTQTQILAARDNLKIVGVGDLVREELKKDTSDPFVAEIKKRYDAGIPQPDDVAIDLVKNFLTELDQSVILDNFPFRRKQAEFLNDFISKNEQYFGPVIVYIKISAETAIKRVVSRRVCTSCGAIFAGTDEMICSKCGGPLIVRADDNEETMRNRIGFYLPKIQEIVDFYGEKDVVIIDGEKSVEEVAAEIEIKLNEYFKSKTN